MRFYTLSLPRKLLQAARPEAWKFLLGVHSAESTAEQRRGGEARRLSQYQALKAQWESIGDAQAVRFAKWREVGHARSLRPGVAVGASSGT